jgi:tryptophan-rich sensory protein
MQALVIKCIDKGAHYMLLPYHILEKLWSPLAGQYLIAHVCNLNPKQWLFYEQLTAHKPCFCGHY